jgi:hypothetical protein
MTVKQLKSLLVGCVAVVTAGLWGMAGSKAEAQGARPFGLPFGTPPGPAAWFSGQQHGNTTGAFNFGTYWYSAGQGMHFGIDLSAPCGTPVVAAADGIVQHVDNFAFGIRPHNLVISHPDLGYTTLYGHLNKKPTLTRGQPVSRGQVVAETGDPDLTCVSRPHLHFEVRSLDYRTAYNPAALIDADWDMLMSIGSPGGGGTPFVKDLLNPNRWQTVATQPEIRFGGRRLNNYEFTWPLPSRLSPPAYTAPASVAPPARERVEFQRLTGPGCCAGAWWRPDSGALYFYDGPEGQIAAVFEADLNTRAPLPSGYAVYTRFSPSAQYAIEYDGERTPARIRRMVDNMVWSIDTGGAYPRFSPGERWLMWVRTGTSVPGAAPSRAEVWIGLPNGEQSRPIMAQQGGGATWLDDDRIMLTTRETGTNITTVSVYTISTGQTSPLFSAANLRGLSVAPGGLHVMYYLAWQPDPASNGIYLRETRAEASSVRLPFFGGWRWRDSMSLVYIPFAPGAPMKFVLYDIINGAARDLTNPDDPAQRFSIANDDWSISPDGRHIAYWDSRDYAIWTLRLAD